MRMHSNYGRHPYAGNVARTSVTTRHKPRLKDGLKHPVTVRYAVPA